MRNLLAAALVLATLASTSLRADEASDNMDRIVDFLKKNVMGRTLITPRREMIFPGTTVRSVFQGSDSFGALKTGFGGFSYETFSSNQQTIYRIDAAGREVPEKKDGMNVNTCEFRVVKSPEFPKNKLAGSCRNLSHNTPNVTQFGYSDQVTLEFDGTKLVLRSYPKPFAGEDCFDNNGASKYRLCTSMVTITFEVKDSKLQKALTFQRYWITDPVAGTIEKAGEPVTLATITE